MSLLTLSGLSVFRGTRAVVDDVSASLGRGECIGLVGPNGSGKTTLLRAALGLIGAQGTSSLATLGAAERARRVAWMPQAREIAWPVSVETVIALGRLPHLPRGARLRDADRTAVERAIAHMGLEAMRNRAATRLSGGEQARVLIARALAQETPLVLADEPIAGLDPAHQIATMELFAGLARGGRSIIVSLHDLGLAARHCTRLLMLDRGRLVADGPPNEVLTAENVAQVFGITAFYRETPQGVVFQPMELTG
ncbi:ABC transporter ATP-binding protein [Pontibaca methylaminivorans]|uniref:ABC transporter ATP-binding protein n=1 Tax=Pontibaca methylaminivorans TaxID=515897 RepID=UPI002FDAF4B5